jgi:glycosyltransferase involved in cell wall biosynthesis
MTVIDRAVSTAVGISLADDDPTPPKLGLIVRYDEGGLGAQTWEYARHLRPEALLMLSVPPARGEEHPERYFGLAKQAFWSSFPPGDGELAQWSTFAEACDVVLTAETCYLKDFPTICARANTKLVVHANPELWEWGSHPPFEPWVPTNWMMGRMPGNTPVVPVPVDRDRCAPRVVSEVRTLLHVSAPAMLDRNGTQLLKEALPHCRTSFALRIVGPNTPRELIRIGEGITVEPVGRRENYWDIYEGADALVLPRRYGGLCLPMQEAASCGLPVISTYVPPQKAWLAPRLSLSPSPGSRARMKGGMVNVWKTDPRALASTIDRLVAGETLTEGLAASSRLAEELDWARWEPIYATLLS